VGIDKDISPKLCKRKTRDRERYIRHLNPVITSFFVVVIVVIVVYYMCRASRVLLYVLLKGVKCEVACGGK
jgi:hypothetical protein